MAEQRQDGRDVRDEAPGAGAEAVRGPAGPDESARAWAALVATARRTVADGLVVGTSGNVSVRVGDTVLVTPSGVPYDRLTPEGIVGVDLTGRQILGTLTPTSELPMHLAVYRATDARAVVHTHAVHATAVSTLVRELPLIHYMAGDLGGPVRVAPYATYGTEELAGNMLRALAGRAACLLQNHGTIVHGATLDQAYDRTAQLEWMCRVWLTASSVPGLSPTLLSEDQVGEAAERLKGYGQRR
ncbi:class II aldolase/adducin family protein [Streptomyces turgidiscabies]|uniref:Putative L-ribulose-5-phosphate 4-epimerase n=1 Tax=Streptomyces turgidiscabies (strain Car8) TaxID=698760 RepID=L7FEC2_STRT8|nr:MULTISPECIES: class II aldolase/adducin family protein [Streptomyces]ELP69632.1 putative L-ribulose-5-phosphate 4-epimerase [Streptomyces turgidiscabies Car8]MDX3498862.1 class II aldolase/adducin family protein [Streptomyces turgidiscabies]GAQ76200.1 L-fuculose phosphate aldolase [Streptomyces turgidiscabies]